MSRGGGGGTCGETHCLSGDVGGVEGHGDGKMPGHAVGWNVQGRTQIFTKGQTLGHSTR